MPYRDKKKRNEHARKWALAHPQKTKLAHRRGHWKAAGMKPDDAQAIYESTDKCGICGKTTKEKNKHIDHNGKTGVIRGVLCSQCNLLVGLAQEDKEILASAIRYLGIIP
jgi:hypothetical protein